MSPKRIGRYRLIRRLTDSMGMAEVFLAQREGGAESTPVVLKRIHPTLADSVDFVSRFTDEIELAEMLQHPNIVEVYDHGEDGGHYFVMEHVDGPNLEVLLESGPLRPELVAYIGVELARALAYLHHSDPVTGRKPVIHSDVSPHNVLMSQREGSVKLSDFGLAKAIGRTGAETITRTRGKPLYHAPEQLLDEPVSAKTDLFALGLVLWRALVGTHPYAEDRPRRGWHVQAWVNERTSTNQRRSVREAAPEAPAALQRAIERLLQMAADRTETAEVLMDELRSVEPLDGHEQLAARIAAGG